jgi:predicted transcriptional regulator
MSPAGSDHRHLEDYQRRYLEKEELYGRYRQGAITLDELARRVNEIDNAGVKRSRWLRFLVGAFLPLLFVRPSR